MRIRRVAAVAAAAVLTACALAPVASAENVDLGGTADDSEIQQHWTVGDLMPSSDAIAYRPTGTLWEATVTTSLDNGGVPVISGFSARSDDNTYPVLWNIGSPMGIPAGALPPGGSASGKIYFDVTGAAPTAVAYTVDGADAVVWD